MNIIKKNLKIKAELKNWQTICVKIKKFLKSLQLLDNQISVILIVCEEIFVNISSYAYPNKSGFVNFDFEWNCKNCTLKIISRDSGVCFNPLKFTKNKSDTKRLGGNGILLIKKLTDTQDYRFENGFNILSISKYFN